MKCTAYYIWEMSGSLYLLEASQFILGVWEAWQLRNFLSLIQGFQNLVDHKIQFLPTTH